MSNKNLESTELRQDTTLKQTNALEARIKYFQEQQSDLVSGKFIDIITKGIMGAAKVGKALKKIIPEESQKEVLKIYQQLLLFF